MFEKFNEGFPRMRPVTREVYGKLIFLAGVENEALREQAYQAGIRDILVSYYYLRDRKQSTIREELKRFDNVILDSGGFTYIQKMRKGHAPTNEEIQYYTEQYIRFCDEMADCFNYVFEMDMAAQISEEYRNAHIQELQDRGIRIVPIVHADRIDRIEELGYFNYPLVAFAGNLTGGMSGSKMSLMRKFQERGILVHGLAATDEASINRVPFFSVDSSSWLAGGKFGLTYIWSGTKITVYESDKKEIRLQHLDKFEKAGLDVEGIKLDRAPAINTMNAWAWAQYIDYVKYNITQSYWLTDAEKAAGKDFLIQELKVDVPPVAKEKYEEAVRSPDLVRSIDVREAIPGAASQYIDPRMAIALQCNNCSKFQQCPAYKKDAACYYHSVVSVSNLDDTIGVMGALMTGQYSRIAHAMLAEKFDGGNLDPNINKEINTQMKLAQVVGNLFKVKVATEGINDPPPGVPPVTRDGEGTTQKQHTIEAIFSEVVPTEVIPVEQPKKETPPVVIHLGENDGTHSKESKTKKTFQTGFSENPSAWPDNIFS